MRRLPPSRSVARSGAHGARALPRPSSFRHIYPQATVRNSIAGYERRRAIARTGGHVRSWEPEHEKPPAGGPPARDTTYSRTVGPLARSPAERLEPTRPATAAAAPPGAWRAAAAPADPALPQRPADVRPAADAAGRGRGLPVRQPDRGAGPAGSAARRWPSPRARARTRSPRGSSAKGSSRDRRLFIAGYLWAKFAARLEGGKPVQLRAGDYAVKQNASIRQVIDLLSEGKTVSYG